jgi:predicted TIM-barrel fold metal-dependent hydrolase
MIDPAMIPACPAPREPSRPRIPLPPKACDTHAHVFGPATRFPYAADRSYTPPDAPLARYLGMLDTLGFARVALATPDLIRGSGQRGHSISARTQCVGRHKGGDARLRGLVP